MFEEQFHQLALDNWIHNVHQYAMFLWEDFDKHIDIHYQEYIQLDDAKKDVIDCKLMVDQILETLLKKRNIKVMMEE